MISYNSAMSIKVEDTPALEGSFITSASKQFQDRLFVDDAEWVEWMNDLQPDDRIINVLNIGGPITRDGGACSYGSRDHRDWLMKAADMEQVIGHIIIINSGGGSAMSKYDYEQAIDYIHSKGQKVIAFIDGMAASAAYAVACMCDEVYVMNLGNQVGCIGSMCAFYLQRHGDVNPNTLEKYVEVYAKGSPYKNRETRDAAGENYESLIKMLDKSADDFKNLVRKNRPNVTEEQLLGDTYQAEEVVGSLIDGQKTFEECVDRLLEISGYAMVDGVLTYTGISETDPKEKETDNKDINLNQNYDMGKEYPKIMAAAGAHALISDKEDAVYLHKDLCETLEAHLTAAENVENALSAKTAEVVALTEKLNAMETAHAEAIEKLNADHAAAIDTMKSEHETALKDAADKAEGEMADLKAEHEKTVNELSDKLAAAEKSAADKDAEIAELAGSATPVNKGEAPVDNATGARSQVRESVSVIRPGMTAKESREALAKLEEKLAREI
jgi:ClpP class serine protease